MSTTEIRYKQNHPKTEKRRKLRKKEKEKEFKRESYKGKDRKKYPDILSKV